MMCVSVCFQVQDELSRMTVKLHGEETLRQQLSEEFEQVGYLCSSLTFSLNVVDNIEPSL